MSRKPTDAPSGERNEYIPQFIAKKPFYVDDDTNDYLEHQRLHKAKSTQPHWYERGRRAGPAATKYRKGACENCGSMTHKSKECLSRPRKHGAKWTGKDIQADEIIQNVELDWESKRDRWNGYDPSDYRHVVQEYEELEDMKKKTKSKINGQHKDSFYGDEEAKYAEESDMGRHQSTATRNLRIREDTAKYLLNLNLDSAKYDPKSRSMIDMGTELDQASSLVAEENFVRASGDAADFERAQRLAWESQERGGSERQHLQANPTATHHQRKRQEAEAESKRQNLRKTLLEKYGGEEHLQPPLLRDSTVTENERFVEYDETGFIKGASKPDAKSRYAEDIHLNNHTAVWGSWWSNFVWGYACCHSTVKNSYCTGEVGKQAFQEAENMLLKDSISNNMEKSDTDAEEKEEKPAISLKKRTIHEMREDITEEEMEAYKKARASAADPMAAYLEKDGLMQ